MSAHASQAFSIAHCTDSEDLSECLINAGPPTVAGEFEALVQIKAGEGGICYSVVYSFTTSARVLAACLDISTKRLNTKLYLQQQITRN